MLFLISGASGVGKSTVRQLVTPRLGKAFEAVELCDLGSVENVTIARRQELAEVAAKRAAELARVDRHLLLSGDPVAPAEVMAAPSAVDTGGIAVCLLDADPITQTKRLAERGDDLRDLEHHIAFADWMREHAVNPLPRLDVVQSTGWSAMAWERLSLLIADDPRWRVYVIDTSNRSREEGANEIETWIKQALTDDRLVMRLETWR